MAIQTSNMANIYYKYASNTTVYSGNSASNSSVVYILDSGVSLTKSVDKLSANLLDTVTYTIAIKNVGTDTITNMIIIDTLPTGLTFNQGSLTYNGAAFGSSDITLGVTIPSLNVGSTTTLTFISTVSSAVTPIATNVAKGNYVVTAGASTIPVSTMSNGASISIINKSISFMKFQSTSTMNIGDTGVYSFIISNTGNVPISNIYITDTVPAGLSFVPGTLRINGIETVGTPETGIFFGNLNPNEGILVSYSFTAVSTPNGGVINNTANMYYDYINGQNVIVHDTTPSNQTTLKIEDVQVFALQSASKTDVMVGDTVTYTVNVQNLGTVDITKVLAYATVPLFSLAYIPNSLFIDGVNVPDQNIITGISLPDLLANGITTVSLTVQVLNDSVKDILTIFDIYFDANVSPYSLTPYDFAPLSTTLPGYNYIAKSNPWNLYILNPNLSTTKSANNQNVKVGDEVIYTIALKNTGSDILSNMVFYDTMPSGITFMSGYLSISGTSLPLSNPSFGITLPNSLSPNETVTITLVGKA
ncbi:MAG: hypothetical protein ACRC28_06525 [Clostridium sp.]|uniref:hypothetical protein n=1 Tax=Clostridium sp. TaxID=1506 RepID=UPI003F4152CA